MPSPNDLSFLPEDFLQARARRRTNLLCAGLFLVGIAAIGGGYVVAERRLEAAEVAAARVDRQYADAAQRVRQAKAMQDKQRRLAQQADRTATLLEKVPRSTVLAALTNALPAGAVLTDLELTTRPRPAPPPVVTARPSRPRAGKPSPETPPPPPPEVTVRVIGLAASNTDVATFMHDLAESEWFVDVNLLNTQQAERGHEGGARKFSVEATINPRSDGSIDRSSPPTAAAR